MRESAVSDKPLLFYGLARNRRSPKRPSEPRLSGVHPEEGAVGGRRAKPLLSWIVGFVGRRYVPEPKDTRSENKGSCFLSIYRSYYDHEFDPSLKSTGS